MHASNHATTVITQVMQQKIMLKRMIYPKSTSPWILVPGVGGGFQGTIVDKTNFNLIARFMKKWRRKIHDFQGCNQYQTPVSKPVSWLISDLVWEIQYLISGHICLLCNWYDYFRIGQERVKTLISSIIKPIKLVTCRFGLVKQSGLEYTWDLVPTITLPHNQHSALAI